MLAGRNPRLAILILPAQIHTLLPRLPPLAQRPRALGHLTLDRCILLYPVRERVLAVLDNGLAGLVSVVRIARLAGRDRSVVDEFEEMLAVAGDDGEFLRVLAECVELVGEGCLELLARDVGELGLGDERLGFGADQLLLEDDDLGAVGFLVFQLGDLVGDLLLA